MITVHPKKQGIKKKVSIMFNSAKFMAHCCKLGLMGMTPYFQTLLQQMSTVNCNQLFW